MQGQQYTGPVESLTTIQAIHGDVHLDGEVHLEVNQVAPAALPDDVRVVIQCPQCERPTWRYTRHCLHCSLDLRWWFRRYMEFDWWLLKWIQK